MQAIGSRFLIPADWDAAPAHTRGTFQQALSAHTRHTLLVAVKKDSKYPDIYRIARPLKIFFTSHTTQATGTSLLLDMKCNPLAPTSLLLNI